MIKKYIPDFITSLNLACGITGVMFVLKGRIDVAFCLMLAATVFDFLDGLAARTLHAYSDLGKELDSLSDLVSFGVLPSVMLYTVSRNCMFGESLICWTPLLLAVFGGLRLAKFNVDTRQTDSFLGLPIPACGLLTGSLCSYVCYNPAGFPAIWMAGPVFVPVLVLVLCALLVCEIPMFSLKFHKDDTRSLWVKRIAMAAVVILSIVFCIIFRLHWSLVILITFTVYIIKNLIYWLARI